VKHISILDIFDGNTIDQVIEELKKLKEKYPNDTFYVEIVDTNEWENGYKIYLPEKCEDCGGCIDSVALLPNSTLLPCDCDEEWL
jgi:hypothetical protein